MGRFVWVVQSLIEPRLIELSLNYQVVSWKRPKNSIISTFTCGLLDGREHEGIEGNGDVTVNFPEQNRWTGLLTEMERLEVTDPETTGPNTPSPLLGPFDSATVAATLQGPH